MGAHRNIGIARLIFRPLSVDRFQTQARLLPLTLRSLALLGPTVWLERPTSQRRDGECRTRVPSNTLETTGFEPKPFRARKLFTH